MRDIAEIRKLPIPERLQLVGEIWDSILDDPSLLPVSDELARELELRLAAHRKDPDTGQAWDSVDREVFGTE
jgi:putative addiction module component (TIGR02574 family)